MPLSASGGRRVEARIMTAIPARMGAVLLPYFCLASSAALDYFS